MFIFGEHTHTQTHIYSNFETRPPAVCEKGKVKKMYTSEIYVKKEKTDFVVGLINPCFCVWWQN